MFERPDSSIYDISKLVLDSHGHVVHALQIMYYEHLEYYETIFNLMSA